MTTVTFRVKFHTPFLVRSGAAGDGLDAVARPDAVLPASSLKGAMRGACEHVLHVDSTLRAAVFGVSGRTRGPVGGGAWAWTDARGSGPVALLVRARNRVDPATGVALAEALTYSEEYWQEDDVQLAFDVEQRAPVAGGDVDRHVALLQVAAHAVTALGSWRNRGMGTVTIRPAHPLPDLAEQWDRIMSEPNGVTR